MPSWVKAILIGSVLDNLDEIEAFLLAEAQKTDNKLDDALVGVFISGLEAVLEALK